MNIKINEIKYSEIIIYGAGSAGRKINILCKKNNINVVAFLDDNHEFQNNTIDDIPVLNPSDMLPLNDKALIFALPSLSDFEISSLITKHKLEEYNIYSILSLEELLLLEEKTLVENNSIILRKFNMIDRNNYQVKDKVILVTGAAGSIGSEIVRQLMISSPKKIICFDHNEFGLYTLKKQLSKFNGFNFLKFRLGSVLDKNLLDSILEIDEIDLVFHAAAYKHVPLLEENVYSGMKNNIIGTYNIVTSCIKNGVKDFCLVSTDKAVRPTNYMGASKRICELICLAYEQSFDKLYCVRFGNVLNSAGSVVPLFQQQARVGGPITVTHKDMTRYFMTIPQAAQLVLNSYGLDERGPIFLFDMGEPHSIDLLARKVIILSGNDYTYKKPTNNKQIQILFTGIRSGEKLYEELLIEGHPKATSNSMIYNAEVTNMELLNNFQKKLPEIVEVFTEGRFNSFQKIINTFVIDNQIKDWDIAL